MPADSLDDAVQLVVGGRVAATHGKNEVDRIEQAREGLREVGRLVRLQRVLQSLLWTTHKHKPRLTKLKIYTKSKYYETHNLFTISH